MDWIEEFIAEHGEKKELKDLEKEKFYGNLQLNFNEGKVTFIIKTQNFK